MNIGHIQTILIGLLESLYGLVPGEPVGSPTTIVGISGTIAEFNTALSDGDLATLAGTETLTNKTLTAPLISSMTAGSVFFAGASGLVSQDNANFFWDDTNNRLGIGTSSPVSKIHLTGITGGSVGIRLDTVFDGNSNYWLKMQRAGSFGVGYYEDSVGDVVCSDLSNNQILFGFPEGLTNARYMCVPDANARFSVGLNIVTEFNVVNAKFHIKAGLSSTIGQIIQGGASRSVALVQLQTSAGGILGNVGGTAFHSIADVATTNVDGTEDDLFSYTTIANTFAINGDSIHQIEQVALVASATATRRVKKYFAGTLVYDSGAITLTLGGDFTLETTVIRESSTVVRVSVNVVTTSASTVPYSTYTRITGLTLTTTNILKTTGIAASTGAAAGDIANKMARVTYHPAAG